MEFEVFLYFCIAIQFTRTKMVSDKNPEALRIELTLADVWHLLTEHERNLLLQGVEIRRYAKNDIIYHEGDTPLALYCPATGKVKIYKTGVGGRQQIVRIVKPREFFGYRASFAGENYIGEAGAFEDSTILYIPLSVARRIIVSNHAITIYFLQKLAEQLGNSAEQTISLTQKHVRGRLAETLLRLKNSFGVVDDQQTLAITASREDLANLSNMTTSNAIRTLSAFAQEGIVKAEGRNIILLDEDQLQKISDIG